MTLVGFVTRIEQQSQGKNSEMVCDHDPLFVFQLLLKKPAKPAILSISY